jgi:hypothetical protein
MRWKAGDVVFVGVRGSRLAYSLTAFRRSIENGCVRAIRSHDLREDGDIDSNLWKMLTSPRGS